jgi:cytochrome c peroxidase
MKKSTLLLSFFSALVLFTACSKKADFNYYYYTPEEQAVLSKYLTLPELPDDYTISFPSHLRNSGLFPRTLERDKAVLGRVLFYDKNLSKDGTISCGSCHKQNVGFGDDKKVSLGVANTAGDRNSIALSSVANFSAYYGTDLNGSAAIRFFWDNRAATAMEQSHGSITNPKEMNMTMSEVVAAVKNQPYYEPLLKKAFGDNGVTEDRVLESIANFVNAMGSYQSKFDDEASKSGSYIDYKTANFTGFTASESAGKDLYMNNCASCHSQNMGRPVLFNTNNGLLLAENDLGVGSITHNSIDNGTFKVPTLRNIALTAPYMHDGRFSTLDEVLEHYSHGIQNAPNLSNALKNNGVPVQMNFTTKQKQDLIAFLNTLTDNKVSVDQRFGNPFKQ